MIDFIFISLSNSLLIIYILKVRVYNGNFRDDTTITIDFFPLDIVVVDKKLISIKNH